MFSLIRGRIFFGGFQPVLQVLKLSLFRLRSGRIHFVNSRRCYLRATDKVLEACVIVVVLGYICGCNIYYCGLYVQDAFYKVVFSVQSTEQANRAVITVRVMRQPPQESTVKLVSVFS